MVLQMEAPLDRGMLSRPDPQRHQSQLVEYEILDSSWTHQHHWIWLSGLVLITLSMFGMTFLPVGLTGHSLQPQIVTFISAIAVSLTVIWWGILRQMLNTLNVIQHRKREIERSLGLRMEFYLAASRTPRKRQRIRDFAQQEAGDDPELRADLADFLRSTTIRPGLLPGEGTAWNIVPLFFVVAWIAFWGIVAGPAVLDMLSG